MGDEADDILRAFALTDEHRNEYECVKSKFDEHFVPRRNVIFERAKFNMRRQEESESVDAYITDLYTSGALRLWGTAQRDDPGSYRGGHPQPSSIREDVAGLQANADSAITQVRQSETVKLQQSILRGNSLPVKPEIPVGAVQKKGGCQWKPGKSWGSQNSGATNHILITPGGVPGVARSLRIIRLIVLPRMPSAGNAVRRAISKQCVDQPEWGASRTTQARSFSELWKVQPRKITPGQ